MGICGGFQMIGRSIADPHRIESDGRTIEGLGLNEAFYGHGPREDADQS